MPGPVAISAARMARERHAATARPARKQAHHAAGALVLGAALLPTLLALLLGWLAADAQARPLGEALPHLALDLRSLALGRALMGASLLLDLRERVRDLEAFYSDDGCIPRHVALGGGDPRLRPTDFSFYFATGAPSTVALLLSCSGASAVSLMLGYHTRLSCFLCWLHWRSIEARNGPIHQAGDLLLRLMLWWGLFLPLGELWSLDAYLAAGTSSSGAVYITGLPTVGFVLQLGSVYFFTALVKVDVAWSGGSAVELTCRNHSFAREPFTTWLLALPRAATATLSVATWYAEIGALPLLFCPVMPVVARCLAIFLFLGFHSGLGIMMRLGLFPMIACSAWLMLIPTAVWDSLLGATHATHAAVPAAGWALGSVTQSAGALLSIVLAFRSNISRLPPLPQPKAAAVKDKNDGDSAAAGDGTDDFRSTLWGWALWLGVSQPPGAAESEFCRLIGQHQQWFLFDRPSRDDHWFVTLGRCQDGTTIDLFNSVLPVCSDDTVSLPVVAPVMESPAPPWGKNTRDLSIAGMYIHLTDICAVE